MRKSVNDIQILNNEKLKKVIAAHACRVHHPAAHICGWYKTFEQIVNQLNSGCTSGQKGGSGCVVVA